MAQCGAVAVGKQEAANRTWAGFGAGNTLPDFHSFGAAHAVAVVECWADIVERGFRWEAAGAAAEAGC